MVDADGWWDSSSWNVGVHFIIALHIIGDILVRKSGTFAVYDKASMAP